MNLVTPKRPDSDSVLVTVVDTRGSVPRDAGAWMLVGAGHFEGSIGGGHLELQALDKARDLLAAGGRESTMRLTLGPSLGQCCGGVVGLKLERVASQDVAGLKERLAARLLPLALFGGGHVGTAIVQALAPLPFAVRWIDSRGEIFPASVPANVSCEHSDPVQAAVNDLPAGSLVLVMSFSHAEDLDIVAQCLRRLRARDDLPYVGLIGSKTKWAAFRHRLAERGFADNELERITCPIGIAGIAGKEPAVIAAGVAAQLLQAAQPRR